MHAVTRTSLGVVALCALLWGLPSSAAAPDPVARPEPVCALVSGGLGTGLDDLASRLVWSAVNRQVHEHLVQRLQSAHHRILPFFVETGELNDADDQRQAVDQAWLDGSCPLLVQVFHVVDEEAGEPVFGFDIQVASRTGPGRHIETPMNQRYRFPRNRDAFENFRVGELVEDVVVLLAANGLIDAAVTVGPITPSDLKAEYQRLKVDERLQGRQVPPLNQVRGRLVLRVRDRLAAGLTPAGASAARGTAGAR